MSDNIGVVPADVNDLGADSGSIPENAHANNSGEQQGETAAVAPGRLTAELFEASGLAVTWEPAAPLPTPAKVDTDLDRIAARINTAIEASEVMTRNALRLTLDAGDQLIAAQERVPEGEWESWLSKNCPRVKIRMVQVYMQLARHRDKIEAALRKTPDLSLRVARRLIMKNDQREDDEDTRGAPSEPKIPDWVKTYNQSSDEDKTAGSDVFNLKDFFAHMSATKRAELEELVLGNAEKHCLSKRGRATIHKLRKRPFLELEANPIS